MSSPRPVSWKERLSNAIVPPTPEDYKREADSLLIKAFHRVTALKWCAEVKDSWSELRKCNFTDKSQFDATDFINSYDIAFFRCLNFNQEQIPDKKRAVESEAKELMNEAFNLYSKSYDLKKKQTPSLRFVNCLGIKEIIILLDWFIPKIFERRRTAGKDPAQLQIAHLLADCLSKPRARTVSAENMLFCSALALEDKDIAARITANNKKPHIIALECASCAYVAATHSKNVPLQQKAKDALDGCLLTCIKNIMNPKEEKQINILLGDNDNPRKFLLPLIYININNPDTTRMTQWCDIAILVPNILDIMLEATKKPGGFSLEKRSIRSFMSFIRSQEKYHTWIKKNKTTILEIENFLKISSYPFFSEKVSLQRQQARLEKVARYAGEPSIKVR